MRLQLQGIGKHFGPEAALRRIDLALAAGGAAAVVGGRGAGKSVLAGLLAGRFRPDAGSLRLDGRPFAPRSPRAARLAGVSVLGEAPALAPHLTAAENLALGLEPGQVAVAGWIARARRRDLAARALAALHSEEIPLELPVAFLGPSQRRRLELARALMGRPRVLVLDEPGPLAAADLQNLCAILRARAREGASVLMLTRSLELARELGGHLVLLREGEIVACTPAARLGQSQEETLGRLESDAPLPGRRPHHVGGAVLDLRGACTAKLAGPVSLTLRQGEIFGLAGLPGSGRRALLRALFGLDRLTEGALLLDGKPLGTKSARSHLRAGIGLVGAEATGGRNGEGEEHGTLFACRSVAENLTLAHLRRYGACGCFSWERQMTAALDWMAKLHLHARRPTEPAGALPRGSRRKIAIGRLLHGQAARMRTRVLLLEEPGSGIDAASRAWIYGWIGEMAAEGRAILLSASSFAELLALCDTVGVMRRGRLVAVRPAREWAVGELAAAASGILNRRFAPSL